VTAPAVQRLIHIQFLTHATIISLMIVATFIDFDEKTIPDAITIPGTLGALLLMAWQPDALPPIAAGAGAAPLSLTSPNTSMFWADGISGRMTWPSWLDERDGLLVGLACYLGWCFAILPKTWTTRRGLRKAMQYFCASVVRNPGWRIVAGMAVAGGLFVLGIWWRAGASWQSLLSSLVGMAFGGGLVWAVRIIASGALGKEAMGFGDVTLMSMVGAFIGWQPALTVFFLAPFAAMAISITQWLLTRRKDIAFGPYLCLAALAVILFWAVIWQNWARQVFSLGWFIPVMVAVCLVLMAGLLLVWRIIATCLEWLLYRG
jgi:prepilin signal peptidase PulO-like enzyme (type II secretory pathway)